jgi:cytochrome c5
MPQKANSQNDPKAGTSAIPDDVNTIFKNSCVGCHADGGSGMAKSHVNFSKWNEYTADKQASKAEDICKVLTKGSMPPKKFKAQHPDLVPTEAQVKSICDWANSLKKK